MTSKKAEIVFLRVDGRVRSYSYIQNNPLIPIGYCQSWGEMETRISEWLPVDPNVSNEFLKLLSSFKHKFHGDNGHATVKEARECYRQYLIDVFWEESDPKTTIQCCLCTSMARTIVTIQGQQIAESFALCRNHKNRDAVDSLFKFYG